MRVDAHAHVWRAVTTTGTHGATIVSGECHIPADLLLDYLDEHGIDRAVLVQPIFPGTDNSYIADCAARNQKRLASVCVVDPRQSDAADQLRYWVTERGCRGVRLRPRIAAESAIFGDPSTWPLWQAAQELGVVVSILASPEHLRTIADLAERFAPLEIVLDHFAHPTWLDSAQWEITDLLALARHPHVHVKVSGYHYFSRDRYPYAESRALVAAVLDAFGPERLLWGSDFPHVLLRSGYGRSLRLVGGEVSKQVDHADMARTRGADVDLFSGRLSVADRDKILGANARRLYWPGDK